MCNLIRSGSQGASIPKGQQCDGDDCKQTFLDCMAQCIRAYDPLNDESKIGLTAIGGTFPKSWVGLPRGLGGASRMTTVPSATAHALGGGGAGTLGGAACGLVALLLPYGLDTASTCSAWRAIAPLRVPTTSARTERWL